MLVVDMGGIATTMAVDNSTSTCTSAQSFELPGVGSAESLSSISCGRAHYAIVTQRGKLFTWGLYYSVLTHYLVGIGCIGCGADGRLGHGTQSDLVSPKPHPNRV